jgi:hypothetical protein
MAEGECNDQKKENRQEPNKLATVGDLKSLGISYWKMDADAFEYPVNAVPWDPEVAVDPQLKALRDDRGYSYADIISIHPDLCECAHTWMYDDPSAGVVSYRENFFLTRTVGACCSA